MPSRVSTCHIVLSLLVTLATPALGQDSNFVRALRGNSTSFTIRDGELTGEGAAVLARAAREHQFLLVGEDHGISEVPEFVGALFAAAVPAGYRHLAVEIGPITGRYLDSLMRGAAPQKAVDDFLAQHTGFTLPFFFWREESAMLERAVKLVRTNEPVVWGLDQEFMIAPTFLLRRLAELAPTEAARSLAKEHAARSAAGDRSLIEKQNPSGVWMVAVSDASLDSLRAAFKPKAGSKAEEILRELAASRHIYQTFNTQSHVSNQERDDLMKQHFVTAFREAQHRGERTPKVVVKLGANHVFRGPSITGTYEMGSFLPEFGIETGGRTFGILLVVARGTWNAFRPFGSSEADKTQSYDLLTSAEYKVFDMPSVLAAASTTSWTMIDLRPVRARAFSGSLRGLDARALRLLTSFDAVVVVPEGHASTFFR